MTKHQFTFTDRTTWLAYRADWRARYAAASEAVRAGKRAVVAAYAAGRQADQEQSDLHYTRVDARALMNELDEAKEAKRLVMETRRLAA